MGEYRGVADGGGTEEVGTMSKQSVAFQRRIERLAKAGGDSPDMNTAINDIALRELGIVTLKMRRSDELDFHTLSVWQVRAALTAAYEAGQSSAAEAGI
jgi:hypothetical protein